MSSMNRWTALTGALVALAAGQVACGSDALVGGDCAPGYFACGNACCDSASAAPSTTPNAGSVERDSGVTPAITTIGDTRDGGASGSDAGSTPDAASSSSDAASNDADAASTTDDSSTTSSDAAAADDAATADSGPLCADGLTWCTSACVDLMTDPDNCGACDHMCASNVCVQGVCQGKTTGDIVYIGHDYAATAPATSQGRELMNAVLLSSHQPVRVTVFNRWADATAGGRVDTILASIPATLGRAVTVTHTTRDDLVPASLADGSTDVLLVLDQKSANAGDLATVGGTWATPLATFTHAGGVLVVLDGAAGATQEMPALSNAVGLLSIASHTKMSSGQTLELTTPSDGVGIGVVSPYATRTSSAHFATEAASARVVYVATDPASTEPVVVHKVAP